MKNAFMTLGLIAFIPLVSCRTMSQSSNLGAADEVNGLGIEDFSLPYIPRSLELFHTPDEDHSACYQGLSFEYEGAPSKTVTIESHVWDEANCDTFDQVDRKRVKAQLFVVSTGSGRLRFAALTQNGAVVVLALNQDGRTYSAGLSGFAGDEGDERRNGAYLSTDDGNSSHQALGLAVPSRLDFFKKLSEGDDCRQGLFGRFNAAGDSPTLTLEGGVWSEAGCDYYDRVDRDKIIPKLTSKAVRRGVVTITTSMKNPDGTTAQAQLITREGSGKWKLVLSGVPDAQSSGEKRQGAYQSRVR